MNKLIKVYFGVPNFKAAGLYENLFLSCDELILLYIYTEAEVGTNKELLNNLKDECRNVHIVPVNLLPGKH